MSSKVRDLLDVQPVVPSPGLAELNGILQDADALLVMMGREPLHTVAALATALTRSAHDAGALEIEAAASEVGRVASGHGPVALAGVMHALARAISHTESLLPA
jgi:hypothetical protein